MSAPAKPGPTVRHPTHIVRGANRTLYGVAQWSRAEREEAQAALRKRAAAWLSKQAPRHRRIAEGRFFGEETLQSLADRYGISKERVRQVEGRLAANLMLWLRGRVNQQIKREAQLALRARRKR